MQKAGKTHAQTQSFCLQILLGQLRVFGHFLPRLPKIQFSMANRCQKKSLVAFDPPRCPVAATPNASANLKYPTLDGYGN